MNEDLYPKPTKALSDKRHNLTPDVEEAFRVQQSRFKEGRFPQDQATDRGCRRSCDSNALLHSRAHQKRNRGRNSEEIMEAIWPLRCGERGLCPPLCPGKYLTAGMFSKRRRINLNPTFQITGITWSWFY